MRAANLRKTEHRQEPQGYDSCTSKYRSEVVVYSNHHAYPTYIFEHHCPSLSDFDSYTNIANLGQISCLLSEKQNMVRLRQIKLERTRFERDAVNMVSEKSKTVGTVQKTGQGRRRQDALARHAVLRHAAHAFTAHG